MSVAGWKAKSSIVIPLAEAADDVVALEDEVPLDVGAFALSDPPQPTSSAAAVPATAIELTTRRGCMPPSVRAFARRVTRRNDAVIARRDEAHGASGER
jgi:hypothetical protein